MKPVVLIFGPTASGKTALAIQLALQFNGEIVSADSMQIYREMDVGTAKASREEQAKIPHHMIDVCDFNTAYSAARYREDALTAIRSIHARKKLPIVVGGTGLYFDAILHVPSYGQTKTHPEIREMLSAQLSQRGSASLHKELEAIDPKSAERIHENDEKRIIRALEIYHATGKAPSEVLKRKPNTEFDFLSFYLNFSDRQKLYEACDRRVLQMANSGLLEEVSFLLKKGLADSPTASQAIGYKEFIEFHNGNLSLEDSLALIQKRTRNYAKRQITWFSKMDAVKLYSDDPNSISIAQTELAHFLKGAPC